MSKKLISLMLALALLCSVSMAYAAGSKGTGDMTSIDDDDTPLAGWSIIIVDEDIQGLLAEIAAASSLSDYFGIALADSLELVELIALSVENYDPSIGDASQIFTFPTVLSGTVAALIGIDGNWTQVRIEIVDGAAKITFPKALLEAMNGKITYLAILMAS